MCAFHPNRQQNLITSTKLDPIGSLVASVQKAAPWDSITDFATHESYCGHKLYPRQLTLLKLIFLETEQMSAFDVDVIEEWRVGFTRHRDVFGVQPDIWKRIKYLKERGARRFPHIQAVLGRRASKGFIGGILGCEQLAYFYSLDDWQAHFGVAPGKDGFINVGATSMTQAKDHQFADIRMLVEDCKYLQPHIAETKDYMLSIRTPADLRRIAEMRAAGIPIEHSIASLQVQALSASAAAFRGATALGLFLDEFAFMIHGTGSVKSGEEIYEDAHPSLDQFDLDGLTYIPSSPATRIGKAYSLYQEGSVLMSSYRDSEGVSEQASNELQAMAANRGEDTAEVQADPTKLIIQLGSWGLYQDWERSKQLIGITFKRPVQWGPEHETQIRRRIRNPDKWNVERAGQWADVQGAYFDAGKVEQIFRHPGWRPNLEPQSRGYLTYTYRIHCDPGRTGDNFAMCIGHLETAPCDKCGFHGEPNPYTGHVCPLGGKMRPHVIIDLLHVWKPSDFPPDIETGRPTIDYVVVQEDIERILYNFPSTSKISFDQWNSALGIAQLRRKYSPGIRVTEEFFTEKTNQARFEKVKAALNLGFVHSYRDRFYEDGGSLLELEMRYLGVNNGRVDHQKVGPVTTKDLYDAFSVVVADLLHQELERYQAGGLTLAVGSTNIAGLRSGRELERMPVLSGTGSSLNSPNKNRQKLAEQKLSRARSRLYSPGRESSIRQRDKS